MQDNSWLIVGLGNPGPEYAKSRHNIGFRCIDILADKLGVKIDRAKFEGLYGQTEYQGHKLYLLKPLTYMNLSGRSVLQLSSFFKIPPERIIVIFDDISLDPGRLRVRGNGSAGGHNGIKSIIAELGSQEFPRVKIRRRRQAPSGFRPGGLGTLHVFRQRGKGPGRLAGKRSQGGVDPDDPGCQRSGQQI